METRHKHKLVIISDSGLLQRHFDYFYVDNLNEAFDFEYWNCSRLLLKKEHRIESMIERPYDITINSYWHFYKKLRRLPKDTMILYFALFDSNSNKLHIILHHFFKHLVRVRLSMILPNQKEKKQTEEIFSLESAPKSRSIKQSIKNYLYKSDVIKIGIKMLFHPTQAKCIFLNHIIDKSRNYEWHEMSCVPGTKHQINSSNFEKYMRSKNEVADRRFIVYVDQYFPYHKELSFGMPPAELEAFAQSHFSKLNRYFDKIEKAYNCPIVIAAHPLSQYTSNPFNGREIQYGVTDKLISECEGVIMHNSGSITYVILNNKPVVLLYDSEYKQCIWYDGVINLHQKYGIDIVNIDDEDAKSIINLLPEGVRANLIKECCGDVDEENFVYNDVLLVKCLNDIYKEINK